MRSRKHTNKHTMPWGLQNSMKNRNEVVVTYGKFFFVFFFDDALWRGVSEVVIGRMRYRSVYGSKKERNAVGGGKRSQ